MNEDHLSYPDSKPSDFGLSRNFNECLPSVEGLNWPAECRMWMYLSNRRFEPGERVELESSLARFTANWTAHQMPLMAYNAIFMSQIIVIAVDERAQPVSGCSIDSSVSFLKECERRWNVCLLDGGRLARRNGAELVVESLSEARLQVQAGRIHARTHFLNVFARYFGEWQRETWLTAGSGQFARMLGISNTK